MSDAPSARFRWYALAIFAVAFALRLLHILQIRSAPFFTLLMGDSRSYDAWAQQLAAGDWIGRDVFYQAPLYPYFLGVVYTIFGRDLFIVRVLQAGIGSCSCVLLADAARRMWGTAAGMTAGAILAVWAPAIFFDGLLQKSVLDVYFVCLIVWLVARTPGGAHVGRSGARTSASGWLALGLGVGGLSLTRENSLVFVIVLAIWALWRPRPMKSVALFAAGLAVVLAPVAIRNSHLGGGFYITTSQFGPNFYIGNNASADGTYASLRYGRGAPEYERQDATQLAERAAGRRLTPGEVSSYWRDEALRYITSKPVDWLALMGRKFALLWNATEVVDTEGQETYAEWSWPLRVLGPITHFGTLVPLAALGIMLSRRHPGWDARMYVLAALCATYAASVLVFYVFARYRYPLVPFLILFSSVVAPAAAAVPGQIQNSQIPHTQFRVSLAVVIVALIVFCNWPLIPGGWMRAVGESNIGVALQAEQRYDEAIVHYQRAIESRPNYAPALNNLASAYRGAGRVDDAIATYRLAIDAQPTFPDAEYNLANALLEKGVTDEAVSRFETALHSLPDSPDVHNNYGTALVANGRIDEAIREFRRALEIDPESAIAHRNLGNLLDARGDRAGALDHLQRAVRADPGSGEAHYDLGLALLNAGRIDEAVSEFRTAVERMPSSAEAHNNLGIALGSRGAFADAAAQFREALRLKPDMTDARKNLETALVAQRSSLPRR